LWHRERGQIIHHTFLKPLSCCSPWLAGIVLCWVFFFRVSLLIGQDITHLNHFSTSDGLPSNDIKQVETDREGFVWVNTRGGLARFNGRRFVPFSALCPNTSLPDEGLQSLLIDRNSFLWSHTNKGLYRVSLATFEVAFFDKKNWVPSCEDKQGNVWFATESGIARNKTQSVDFQEFSLNIKGKKNAVSLLSKGRGDLLLLKSDSSIFRFDVNKQVFEQLRLSADMASSTLSMASDAAGMLWMSLWYGQQRGLVYYDPYEDRILRRFSADTRGSSTDCNQIFPDGDQVWLATNSGGLCRYAIQEDQFYGYPADDKNANGFLDDQLADVVKDIFGNLWIASPIMLYRAPARLQTTELLSHDPYNPNSLIARPAKAVHLLTDTLLAIGTMKGISLYNRHKKSFLNLHLPQYNNNPYNDQINAFASNQDGSFWAGTWAGLFRLHNRNGSILEYYVTTSNAGENHPEHLKKKGLGAVRRLFKDRSGPLWVVSFGNQLSRIAGSAQARQFDYFKTLIPDENTLNDRVECFLDLNERDLLLGTFDGLVRYDRANNAFQPFPLAFPGLEGPVKITSLARSHTGDVLLIANGQPFRVHWENTGAAAERITSQMDLSHSLHIIEDNTGTVWITQENGSTQIDGAKGWSRFFDAQHYLRDNTFAIRPPIIPAKDRDGNLYFGGSQGVTVLNPSAFSLNALASPLVKITAITVNGNAFATDSSITRMRDLTLSWKQNNLSFVFSVLNSTVPELSRYAYRLNDGALVQLGTQSQVNFSGLPSGTYQLLVKAANSDGVWDENGITLRIVIRPPWWRSTVAYLFYALLLGAAAFWGYRFQLRQKLAEQETRQLREMDDFKSRFFTNISHEFRTPLTVILGVTEQLQNAGDGLTQSQLNNMTQHQPILNSNGLHMIKRNSQNLLRLINQILDLAKMEAGKLSLQLEQADMVAFGRYIIESLHSLAEMKGITLHFEPEADELWMDFDLEKMQSVLFNLLSNALKFTPEGGLVYLKIARTEQSEQPMCRITVRDTGVGIPPENIGRIFERFYRVEEVSPPTSLQNEAGESPHTIQKAAGTSGTGIGLAFTRELVRLLRGDISVKSLPGEGAVFEVTLPVSTAAPKADQTPDHLRIRSLQEAGLDHAVPQAANQESRHETTDEAVPLLLIVEDNDDVRLYLRACLSEQYRILEVRNGQEGIEMAMEHTPDLIVSDVMMPKKDGFELCQTLKHDERTSHIPVVLLTAKASVESRIAGLSRGADAYLSKPFHRKELLLTIANLLHARRLMQERLRTLLLAAQAAPTTASTPPVIAPEMLAVLEIEDVFVQKMRRYVEDNMGNTDLSMDELSRAMTMSYQNLHRKLAALTKLSPVQFIRTIRLQKAMLLLKSTQLSIGDIAFEVGFSDPKYFSRVFTEEFGKPPSAVR